MSRLDYLDLSAVATFDFLDREENTKPLAATAILQYRIDTLEQQLLSRLELHVSK